MKPDFKDLDFLGVARDRVTEVFESKEVFDKYLDIMMFNNIQLLKVFKDLAQTLNVDNAKGEVLDLIGSIVGQPRIITDITTIIFFAYEGYTLGSGYGAVNNLSDTGNYKSLYDKGDGEKVLLSDKEYRLFIKARMFKNNMSATPKGLLDLARGVMGREDTIRYEDGGAKVLILLNNSLTLLEKATLKFVMRGDSYEDYFLPIPVGVRADFGNFDTSNDIKFGFEGALDTKGYDDLSSPRIDGVYSTV